uniref:Uncharacterized protein n=1 Tax=Fusarium oxysporum (strain Fo5176) TaxID=660025 RepID=A0A0D2Y488_FUSOF
MAFSSSSLGPIGHLERLGFGQACVSHWDSVISLLRTAGVARADNNITEATQAHPEEGLQDTGRRRCITCKEEENNDHDNPDHHIKHGSKANSEHGGDSKADTEQDTEDNSPTD